MLETKKVFFIGMVFIMGKGLCAQNTVDVVNYVNTYKGIAISEMQRTGVPAAITLAQGIHESEAGTSELVRRSNNHFGIKCKDEWTGEKVYHDDDARGECFRSYPSPMDSYRDHSDFLKNRPYYAALFTLDPADYVAWANGLRKAGYATNPKYAQILIRLIQDYNLEQYSLIAMGKLKVTDEVVLTSPGAVTNPLSAAGPRDSVATIATVPGATGGLVTSGGSLQERVMDGGEGADGGGVKRKRSADAAIYPSGEFQINRTRVIFAKTGTSLLSVANQYDMPLSRLLEFNDMQEQDVLEEDQLLFLQRKRRTGSIAIHVVREGETLYDICQAEGVRYQDLLEMNHLGPGNEPAAGEKIYLQGSAPSRPLGK